jgi:5-(carboxyamino)imidazole ribonucleotide mutase
MTTAGSAPKIGIIMGSRSDWDTMRHAAEMLKALDVPHECCVISAHRTPDRLYEYAKGAAARGLVAIIAGAGGAAHLPGMTAAMTRLPVFGACFRSCRCPRGFLSARSQSASRVQPTPR